jgi:hypothetical protein
MSPCCVERRHDMVVELPFYVEGCREKEYGGLEYDKKHREGDCWALCYGSAFSVVHEHKINLETNQTRDSDTEFIYSNPNR